MNASDVRKFAKAHLLPILPPSFAYKGRLLYERPVEWLLRGIHFEPSAFDRRQCALHAFVQPLYLPATTLILTLGRRLGGAATWVPLRDGTPDVVAATVDRVLNEGMSLLSRAATPSQLIEHLGEFVALDSTAAMEAAAYSLALIGEVGSTREALDRLIERLARDDRAWVKAKQARAQALRAALDEDPKRVRKLLADWRTQTCTHLGVCDDVHLP